MQWALKTKVIGLCSHCYGNSTTESHLEAHKAPLLHTSRGHHAPRVYVWKIPLGACSLTNLYKLDSSKLKVILGLMQPNLFTLKNVQAQIMFSIISVSY